MIKSLNEANSIQPRANAKFVQIAQRKFLIGGMTADKITSDIYQFRSLQQDSQLKIQWKLLKFKKNLFKQRNSFSACSNNGKNGNKLYIWGGLVSKEVDQICLDQLIQVDVDLMDMKILSISEPVKIHSSSLHYDEQQNSLIAIGGTNQFSTMQTFFYRLKLDDQQNSAYQWKKQRLDCDYHKGFLWQHTSHLSSFSYFTGEGGKFLTTIGGCHYPQSPYNSIVQFDLNQMKCTNGAKLKYGLVSHDSTGSNQQIVIFGGATGGDFNRNRIHFTKGKIREEKGHNAVGCVACQDEKAFYIIGGVSGAQSLNSVVIYKKSQL